MGKISFAFTVRFAPKDGRGILSVTRWYYLSTSDAILSGGNWSTTVPSRTSGTYIWVKDITTYTDGTTSETVPMNSTGEIGNMVYPAGKWISTSAYSVNGKAVPVVLYGDSHYMLISDISASTSGNTTPDQDTAHWKPFNEFQSVWAKIVMSEFGKLASAVFSGDYMFSQQGVDASGNATSDYSGFTNESGTAFQPNILFNFLNGSGHLAHKNLKWDENGNIFMKSSLYIDYAKLTKSVDGNYYADFSTGFNINANIGDGSTIYLPSASAYEGAECNLINSIYVASRSYEGCNIAILGNGRFLYNISGTPAMCNSISPKFCKEINLVAVNYQDLGIAQGVNWIIKNPGDCIINS